MITYSVAIRTLGLSGDALRLELESIHRQTVLPEKIVIYIARGYQRPPFRVGFEEYVEVDKGMVAQRALPYDEIQSDCILWLDDDVQLPPDFARRLIDIMLQNDADCVGVDIFRNHRMATAARLRAALANWVLPHYNQKIAFRLHSYNSFSYINNPKEYAYPSHTAPGPASLWRRDAITAIDLDAEKWMDDLGFAYGDDELISYKLHINGGRLLVAFHTGISYLDAGSASSLFHADATNFYIRSKSNLIRWHRILLKPASSSGARLLTASAFGSKLLWQSLLHAAIALLTFKPSVFTNFCKGVKDGVKYIRSPRYKSLPPYRNGYLHFRHKA